MSKMNRTLMVAEHDALDAVVTATLQRAAQLDRMGQHAEAGELRWRVMLDRQRRDVLAMCLDAMTAAALDSALLAA